jgi:ribosomal protein S3AE
MAKKPKTAKVISRRKKFLKVEVPLSRSTIELIGSTPEEIQGRTIKLDLTRQLKGKSVEATVKIKINDEKLIAKPIKIRLMPYFIRRMIRKRISYVEDSFETPSQESMIQIKPFLITRKRVSRVVRKTLRNKCKNWIEDYVAERKDEEIFNEILSNRLQKSLSLMLKKTYPLSLCEIRVLEIKRPLEKEEIPKIKPKPIKQEQKASETIEQGLDQLAEIEEERKKAEQEIKTTQEKAVKKEATEEKEAKTEITEAKEEVASKDVPSEGKETKEKPKTKKTDSKEKKE